MKRLFFLFHIVTIVLLLSCSLNGNGPDIDYVSVADGQTITDVQSFHEIEIVFTKSMNQYLTEKNVFISGYYDQLYYEWLNGSTALKLALSEPLHEGNEYTLTIGKSCECEEGYDLGEDFSYRFFTYEIDEEFRVLSTSPADGQKVSSLDNLSIVIGFSHPVEYDTVYDKITVSPELNYLYFFSEDRKTLTLDIAQPLDVNKIYTVTLQETLSAHNGKPLYEDYTFSFHTILSTQAFSIERAVMVNRGGQPPGIDLDIGYLGKTEGIEKSMDLLVYFNSGFYLDSLKSSISIEPALSYRIKKQESALRFIFDDPMKPDETYRITFSESATNIYGVSLDREYLFEWVVNGPNSQSPRVESVEIVNPDVPGVDTLIYDYNETDIKIYHNKTLLVYPLDAKKGVDFRMSFSSEIDVYRSLDKVSLPFQSGNKDATSGDMAGYSWDPLAKALTVTFSLPIISGGDAYYKLILNGGEHGIVDADGNYMNENIEIYVLYDISE